MFEFPEAWNIGPSLSKWMDAGVVWLVRTWDPFFDAINTGVLGILVPMERFMLWLPWWFVVAMVVALGWKAKKASNLVNQLSNSYSGDWNNFSEHVVRQVHAKHI